MKNLTLAFLVLILSGIFWSCSKPDQNTGDKYFKEGEYTKAAEEYTEKLKFDPNDVRMLYNRGRAHEEQGEFDLAKADYEKALELDPKNFQVLLSLANLHHEEKNYNNALLYASKAEEIPGAPAMASFMKARALQQMGLLDDALKSYGNAIMLDKDFGQAYLNRGHLKIAMEKKKSACEDFKLAQALDYPGAQDALDKYCK